MFRILGSEIDPIEAKIGSCCCQNTLMVSRNITITLIGNQKSCMIPNVEHNITATIKEKDKSKFFHFDANKKRETLI